MRARLSLLFVVAIAAAPLIASQIEAPRPAAPKPAQTPAAAPAPGPAPAPTVPARPAFDKNRYRIPHQVFVLDNGLRLVVHEDHAVPIVAVNLWYHVGSRNEQRGKTGFAHLFEHFFFNGSENYPHGFREAMDDLGANNRNGTTSTDRTNFFENVPASALERTLYLEADRMGFLAGRIIEGDARARARRGAEREAPGREPAVRAGLQPDRRDASIRPSHPYSWSTIGSMADLNAASLDDVKDWYRTYYGPNNCVLSLAGDITPERALALVKKYFDGIPPGPPLARADAVGAAARPPTSARRWRIACRRRASTASTTRRPGATPTCTLLDLVASVLSGSKSARLDRRLVYEKELATGGRRVRPRPGAGQPRR